ncbi:LysR substrate-binding domain-containing protein [Alicyclobacillus dauci]|uniref:LysR family transcriptional regulator n=1 Tax=Alicyclobacillus dauci TaxID=1475485 RepID=A0ABY6Z3M8_9BACL|nr:LysR substrate-binding domain-containing protein [Alicyclobacillus dauci]WAH37128.1 LysR family transcriptional regulator [Alicyclobacillus dauci]
MQLQQLQYFCTVANMESFTKAAAHLSISQPALSRYIRSLEDELGVALFDRIGRSVRLNSFGRAFLFRIERALGEIATGLQEVRELDDPLSGTVAFGFYLTFGFHLVPDIIGKFHQQYPQVEFKLHQNSTQWIMDKLLSGEVDLCMTSPIEPRKGIAWRKLVEEELFVYLPIGHPLADRSSINLSELSNEFFISLKEGNAIRTQTEELCKSVGFTPVFRFEGEDVPTVASMVAAGLGATLIPAFSGIKTIKQIPVLNPVCRREIALAWLEERKLAPSAELFRHFILHEFDQA